MVRHQLRSHWIFDHLGHAVEDLSTAEADFVGKLGFSVELRERLDDHAVEVMFLSLGGLSLELLAPLPGNTTLRKFLERRGSALHHVAFRVPSVAAELAELQKDGIAVVDKAPRLGSRGHFVAFLHPRDTHGLLVEICGAR